MNVPHLRIRPATPNDEEVLRALARRLAGFEPPPWRTKENIADADGEAMIVSVRAARPDDEVFIGEVRGVAAGCLHVLRTTDFFGMAHAHISVIATSAEAEGTGVGKALMEFAERWARDRQLGLLTLNVFTANTRARRFYERGGFVAEFLKYSKPL